MPNPSMVRRHKGLARHTAHQLLHIDLIRFVVAKVRFEWFTKVRRSLRTLDAQPGVAANTVPHNVKGMRDVAVVRSLTLVRPLSVIEDLGPDADVLVIGPRAEGELLALLAHGFDRRHVRAVDLISYSPWVELGDMHALPYTDDSFDAVVAGWVLAYSDDKKRAAEEILRVARPGGVVAIGVEWNARSDEDIIQEIGYRPGSKERIESADEILALFGSGVGEVLVRQDAPPGAVGTRSLVVLFSTPTAQG
ncbi:MAG: class I SAM-dependent methyltransferase [Microthrixaceae bacterium]